MFVLQKQKHTTSSKKARNEDIEKAINVAYLDDDCEILEQRLHEITNIKVHK